MKQFKQSNKSPVGTSFHDDVINTTVNKLIKVLGKPQYDSNDGRDKINFEWNMELADGNVFTVYDYKEYRKLDLDEIVEWHIGGKHPDVTGRAKICIKQDLEQVKDEWDMVIDNYKKTMLDHYHRFTEWDQDHQPLLNFLKAYYEAPVALPVVEYPEVEDHTTYTTNIFTLSYKGKDYIVRWNESFDDYFTNEFEIECTSGGEIDDDTEEMLINICTPLVKTVK
jgi:hypothetical protein